MICEFCATQCNENAKFCAKCGKPLKKENISQPMNEDKKTKDKKTNRMKINKTALTMTGMIIVYFTILSVVLNAIVASNKEEKAEVTIQENQEIKVEECTADLENINVGDIITLGTFEQDNNIKNGEEPIEWEVIAQKDGKYLLLSHYVIDYKSFDNGMAWDILMANQELNESFCTWERSTVRNYLNSDFYENSFSEKEKENICLVTNTTGDWDDIHEDKLGNIGEWEGGSLGGEPTQDYVFLLSVEEIREYFAEDIWDNTYFPHDTFVPKLVASPTLYAMEKGVKVYRSETFIPVVGGVLDETGYAHYVREDLEECNWNQHYYGVVHQDHMKLGYFCAWGLRSPGGFIDETSIVFVLPNGSIRYRDAEYGIGIRPAMWVQGN